MKVAFVVILLCPFATMQLPTFGVGQGGVRLPTWTIVQHPLATGLTCSPTCSVTLTGAFAAHNVKVVQVQFSSAAVSIVSDTKGGTLVQCPSTLGADATNGGHPIAYTLDTTSSTTGTDVITMSGNTTANIRILELHPSSQTPAAALDFCNVLTLPSSGTTYAGPAETMTGGNDAVAIHGATASNVTAVNSPYSTNQDLSSGNIWATALNQTSVTTPSYTVSPAGVTSMGVIGFGFNASPCSDQTFITMDSTNNTSVSESTLRSVTQGWTGGVWGVTGTAMKFQTAASNPLLNATPRMCGNGSTGGTTSSAGVEYLTATGTSYISFEAISLNLTSVSMGAWFKTDYPNVDTDGTIDIFQIIGVSGGDFATIQFQNNAGGTKKCLTIESNAGPAHSACHDVTTNTLYWLDVEYNKTGTMVMKVYDATGSLLFSDSVAAAGTTLPHVFAMGQSSSTVPTTGRKIDFDSVRISLAGGTLTP